MWARLLVLALSSVALAQGDRDLQFPDGPLGGDEPVADAGPVVIRLEHLEVYADLGPGPGGRAPLDRLLLVVRMLGEMDRLLEVTSAASTLRLAAVPPTSIAQVDWAPLPLPPPGHPLIPHELLPRWIEVVEAEAHVVLPEPDNPGGTYWPSRLYTLLVSGTLDPTDARQTLQRLQTICEPPTGWRPGAMVDGSQMPLLVRGEGADPTYAERVSADGRSFRVGAGLFLEEEGARRVAAQISGCLGRDVSAVATTHNGRALALVYGPSIRIP